MGLTSVRMPWQPRPRYSFTAISTGDQKLLAAYRPSVI
jgi:hypothetical protein